MNFLPAPDRRTTEGTLRVCGCLEVISCSEIFDEFRHRFANSCLSPENHLLQRFCANRSALAAERLGFPADKRGISESLDVPRM